MYSRAIFPDRHRAFGVQLLPLTLGHALLLDRLSNPFGRQSLGGEEGSKFPTYADAMEAAFVASRPWRSGERQVQSRWYVAWMRWKWLSRRWHNVADVDALIAWHRANWTGPRMEPVRRGDGAAVVPGAEFSQILVYFACRHLHCNPQSALDLRVGQLQWDYACHLEQSGAVQIIDQEMTLLERLAQQDAAEKEAPHA